MPSCPACQGVLAKHRILVVLYPPYHIWPPCSFFLLPMLKTPWRGKYIKTLQRCNWMELGSSRSFQNRTTKYILKSDRIAGNTVHKLEVHILKEITQEQVVTALLFLQQILSQTFLIRHHITSSATSSCQIVLFTQQNIRTLGPAHKNNWNIPEWV